MVSVWSDQGTWRNIKSLERGGGDGGEIMFGGAGVRQERRRR